MKGPNVLRVPLIALCLAVFFAGCARERGGSTRLVTQEDLDRFLDKHDVVLLDFYADWCGPCKAMKPTIRKIEQDYAGKVAVGVIDVDDAPELARKYGVASIPACFILQKGKVKSVLRGLRSRSEVEDAIKQAL